MTMLIDPVQTKSERSVYGWLAYIGWVGGLTTFINLCLVATGEFFAFKFFVAQVSEVLYKRRKSDQEVADDLKEFKKE